MRAIYCNKHFEGNYVLKKYGTDFFWMCIDAATIDNNYIKLNLSPDRNASSVLTEFFLSFKLTFKEEDLLI